MATKEQLSKKSLILWTAYHHTMDATKICPPYEVQFFLKKANKILETWFDVVEEQILGGKGE